MTRKTIETKRFSIDFKEDYTQFLNTKGYNWIEFDFLRLRWEADRRHGCMEVEFALLGLGVRIYWTYHQLTLERAVKRYNKMLKGKFIKIDLREPDKPFRTRKCVECGASCTTMLTTKKYECEECTNAHNR